MTISTCIELFHIVHVDRLASIVSDKGMWCDAEVVRRNFTGTMIGMGSIKERRLKLPINCRPGLHVGDCVPFYFCPRSIMLFLIHCANHPELTYKGGQIPILHLQFDLNEVVDWAEKMSRQWAFTFSNAGAYYFEDRCDFAELEGINWEAIAATRWSGNGVSRSVKEGKQAEFLVERSIPWILVRRIGVYSAGVAQQVARAVAGSSHSPPVEVRRDWYY